MLTGRLALSLGLLTGLSLLAGCGGSSGFNPFGSFGSGSSASSFGGGAAKEPRVQLIPNGGYQATVDGRALIDQVVSAEVHPSIGGAVVQATGLAPVQGDWDAALTSDSEGRPDANGVLTLAFRVRRPQGPTQVSTRQSREITAGYFIPAPRLAAIREIRILGASSSRSIRRIPR